MENPWVPDAIKAGLTVKQAEFLAFEGREALYGGAAGGGKSVALLIAALQYIDEPGYSALILRRTFKQLAKSDSILNKSKEWLMGRNVPGVGKARWNGDEHKWTFPNGNTLEFGHMESENAIYDYQGGSWPFVGVDECTQFAEKMLAYPRSRQRRPAGSRMPIRWRGGTNPGGIGHEYVKLRYIKDGNGKDPSTPNRQYFPARLEDNPNIDQAEYVATLKESGIDPITLAQLLAGDWDAVPGGRFRREWFRRYERYGTGYRVLAPNGEYRYIDHLRMIFQTCDPAASEKKTADYTVLSTWGLTDRWELFWLDCRRWQREIPDLPGLIETEYRRWKPQWVAIERVAANSGVYQLCLRGKMIVRPLDPLGEDKLVRATAGMVLAESGRLYFPHADAAEWVNDAETELALFTGDPKKDAHDDIVDTLSYAAKCFEPGEADESTRPGFRSSWGG